MYIYDSVKKTKREFTPQTEGTATLYVCGPTVYDDAHLGHAKSALVFDLLTRVLKANGYDVTYARNITDIDDKIIKKAIEQKKDIKEITDFYTNAFHNEMDSLGVSRPDIEPKATESLEAMYELIQKLIDLNHAYATAEGDVYFDTSSDSEYLKLSHRVQDEDDKIQRVESSSLKRNPADFALWKSVKDNSLTYNSPFGNGRPGWHIECSVMVQKYLGDSIDIHGGGLDLLFPHHENEIAQSEAYSGKKFSNYWVHNGLVMIDGTKMSKSLGNFMTVKDALKDYLPEEIRYAILTHKYSSAIDFSDDLFRNARKRLYYFYSTLVKMNEVMKGSEELISSADVPESITNLESKFVKFMDDDFNSPRVISELADIFKGLNKIIISSKYSVQEKTLIFQSFLKTFNAISSVLRLFEEDPREYTKSLKKKILEEKDITAEYIKAMLSERQSAKEEKDYETADKITMKLKDNGISIQDSPNSVTWDIIF